MTRNKFYASLLRFSNRKNQFLFLVVFILPAFLVLTTFFDVTAQTDKQRTFTKDDLGKEPIQIVSLEADGKRPEIGKPYSGGDTWLDGMIIEFKNVSGRTIININFSLAVRDEETPMGRFLAGDNMVYGLRPDSKVRQRDEARTLAPDETARLSITAENLSNLKFLLKKKKDLKELTEAHITVLRVYFADGTTWYGGRYSRPDPQNPGKFMPENK